MLYTLLALTALGMLAATAAYLLIITGYAVYYAAWATRRLTRVPAAAEDGPDQPTVPAHPPYPLRQAWQDSALVLRVSGRRLRGTVARMHGWFWGRFDRASPVARLISLPLAASLLVATALAAVPVMAGAVTMLLVPAVALLLWTATLVLVVGTLGLAEGVQRAARRVAVACPHPGCYRRFRRPAYACPAEGCARRHPRLAPGRAGVWRHACRCGAGLPTLRLLGRHRLTGFCPHCDRPLPRRVGQVRVEHVPVVGGPDAGKTTFVCLALGAMERTLAGAGGRLSYPDPGDGDEWRDRWRRLRAGERLPKTPVEQPTAVMVDVRPPRGPGRVLYLFDPAGENYDDEHLLDGQRYLDHAELAVLVVDPLTIPEVRRGLAAVDRPGNTPETHEHPHLAREGSGDTVERFVATLRTRDSQHRLRRALVVVSKADLLRAADAACSLGAASPQVRAWLSEVGWGNWARAVEESADQVRYLASGLDIPESRISAHVGWLTSVPADPRPRRRLRPAPREWRSRSRPGGVPRSHVIGRWVMRLLTVPGAIVAAVATAVAPVWWLWSRSDSLGWLRALTAVLG